MKKKLVCLLLSVLMIASCFVFASCEDAGTGGSETTGEGGATSSLDRSSMTLTLWLPCDEDTTEEAMYAVEEAINEITQAEFDTAIKCYFVPDADYDKTVADRVKLIEKRIEEEEQLAIDKRKEELDALKNGVTYVEDTTAYENPNIDSAFKVNGTELSLIVRGATGYTNVEKNQMDIFLVRGEDEYRRYAENYYLSDLNEELSGNSKVLNSYIYPDFLTAAQVDGAVYGIPNNHEVGEYTYFLVNKRIVESEYLDPESLTNLADCEKFIADVAKYYPGVTPVYGTYDPSYYRYWSNEDQSTFSVLASRVTYETTIEDVTFNNIFTINNFTRNYGLFKSLKEKGYVSTADNVKEFGVGYVTGTADEIAAKYGDDYHINIFKRPEGTSQDYLKNVFAVSSYTKSVSRSMEIITMLNTNTQLRTILQYGAEGTHWKYDEENEDIIVQLSDEYKMDLYETGNVYMTYPDYGETLKFWDKAKAQNLDSYIPVTFALNEYRNESNAATMKEITKLSATIWKEIEAMSADEFNSSIDKLKARVANNDAFQKLTYVPSDNDAKKGKTPEKGWIPEGSLTYMWGQYVTAQTGGETAE